MMENISIVFLSPSTQMPRYYSERKITESLGNVTVRGEKDGKGKGKGGARWPRVCLSMYSITENIYCSQLSSVARLLQPERNFFTSYSTRKGLGSLSLCAIALRSSPLTCLLVTVNEARRYFASTVLLAMTASFHTPFPIHNSPIILSCDARI
jgi:hypothetical protein